MVTGDRTMLMLNSAFTNDIRKELDGRPYNVNA